MFKFFRRTLNKSLAFSIPFFSAPPLKEIIRDKFNEAKLDSNDLKFIKAEDSFHSLLDFIHEKYSDGNLTDTEVKEIQCRIFCELGNTYLFKGDYIKAEKSFIESLKFAYALGLGESDPMMLMVSLKLALIYQEIQRHERAEQGFKFVISNLESIQDRDENLNALLGMSYDYYSKFLFTQKKAYQQSIEVAQKSIEICKQVYSESHNNCLNILLDLALINYTKKDYKKSRTHLDKFFAIIDNVTDEERDALVLVVISGKLQMVKYLITVKDFARAKMILNEISLDGVKTDKLNSGEIEEIKKIYSDLKNVVSQK